MRQCTVCNKIIKGRSDKKFCSKRCNNDYQKQKRQTQVTQEVKVINNILLKNRNILDGLAQQNKTKKFMVYRIVLVQLGFDFKYITRFYLNSKNKVYHYVYDYAWMEFSSQEVMIVKTDA